MLCTIQQRTFTKQEIYDQYTRIVNSDISLPISELAKKDGNNSKNRYGNILPYKETAVLLSELNGEPNTRYINANFIECPSDDLFHPSQKFICTQAPTDDSIADFWRMVWEYNTSLIVMLTGLKEKGQVKATRYWPSRVNIYEEHGDTNVKWVKKERGNGIMIRYLEIWKTPDSDTSSEDIECISDQSSILSESSGSGDIFTLSRVQREEGIPEDTEVREITQIHCQKWGDFGVPSTVNYMKNLISIFEEKQVSPLEQVVVHCSAGVGRTGTFIAILQAMHQYKQGKLVDIELIVTQMRSQRMGMVQTSEQYLFIYQVVSELISEIAE
eukprot:TRINITY_DN4006_c0_g1_i5.p1 TRINITY_DN4006_c0_g1~~TRINITY_DN4006_c0_g1_i5.p1  ORF type:complete len:328 (+),score=53.48 TRINITY_DN4006_c0_g1_i5:214-1197(+)